MVEGVVLHTCLSHQCGPHPASTLWPSVFLQKVKLDCITKSDLRHRVHWLPVQQRIQYEVSLCFLWVFTIQQTAPGYLSEIWTPVSSYVIQSRLHSVANGSLVISRTGRIRCVERSFASSDRTPWISLLLTMTVYEPSLTRLSFVHSWRPCCAAEPVKHYSTTSLQPFTLSSLIKLSSKLISNMCWLLRWHHLVNAYGVMARCGWHKCVAPFVLVLCMGPGQPSFSPLSIYFLIFFPFLLYSFFHCLYLFSSFVHSFPFYQNSPTPFPGRRS